MLKINTKITAIGRYIPEKVLANSDLEKMVDTSDEWIKSRTGIEERHIASESQASSDLGINAFQDLQNRYDINPLDIDLIIVATITPDMAFPSTSAIIQEGIGAKNAAAFDINAACSGFIYGLETGQCYISSGKYKKVLLVCPEKMSSITDYTDRNTCVLFGDAAGAVLLEPADEDDDCIVMDSMIKTDGIGKEFLYMLAGGSRNPATHETVEKRMHFIRQEGRSVYKFAVNNMSDSSLEIVTRNGLKGSDIKLLIPHQANKRIIDTVANKLKLQDEQVLVNINKYGNTTAATIPLGMVEALDNKRIKRGDYIVITAFGAGFTWGASLIKWGI